MRDEWGLLIEKRSALFIIEFTEVGGRLEDVGSMHVCSREKAVAELGAQTCSSDAAYGDVDMDMDVAQ